MPWWRLPRQAISLFLCANRAPDCGAHRARYRLGVNDTSVVVEIGPSEFPGGDWYAQYQEASRGGDREEARRLLGLDQGQLEQLPGPG
jgi:hypothetical protein